MKRLTKLFIWVYFSVLCGGWIILWRPWKRFLRWVLKETEAELYSQYQTDVVDCHPFPCDPPISYDEWRKRQ